MIENADISTRTAELLNKAEQKVLNDIADLSEEVREKAIYTLTLPLDISSDTDKVIFQTVPLELLKRDDLIGAIWYMETMWRLWNFISLEIFDKIVDQAIEERQKCVQSEYLEGMEDISSSMDALFSMTRNHADMKNNPKLYLTIWNYLETTGVLDEAILEYDKAIKLWDIDGYLAHSQIYKKQWEYEKSIEVLEKGYSFSKDTECLWQLIAMMCRVGKISESLDKYYELKKISKETVLPFIVYRGTIENDEELWELEDIIANYISEGSLIPMEAFFQLSQSASRYIFQEIKKENDIIETLNSKADEKWVNNDYEIHVQSLMRRLYLMQTDILTLWNTQFIEYYLKDIQQLWIYWSKQSNDVLHEYFLEHFSREVENNILKSDEESEEKIEYGKDGIPGDLTLFEAISVHTTRIAELFFQSSLYDIHKEYIIPILRLTSQWDNDYDDDTEVYLTDLLSDLKNQQDAYNSCFIDIQRSYEQHIAQFDAKYGVYYRIHLQTLAINSDASHDTYADILQNYPDIGSFFWIEKLITWEFQIYTSEEIGEIIETYPLWNVNISEALLFGTLLHSISPQYALYFLINYPNILRNPQAVYIITEGLRLMDNETRDDTMKSIISVLEANYDTRNLFGCIHDIFRDLVQEDLSNEDTGYMLLANGNLNILEGKGWETSMNNFSAASELGMIEGLIQIGSSLQEIGRYDEAMQYFEQALCQEDTILTITKILDCAIQAERFDIAQKYINHAMIQKYDIHNYILAFHLWQGNTKVALLQMISIIKQKENFLDTLEGTIQLLVDTITNILKTTSVYNTETIQLKIFASFILCNWDRNSEAFDAEWFMSHWQYINALCEIYQWEELYNAINISLESLVGDISTDEYDEENISSPWDTATQYIYAHTAMICNTYNRISENAMENNDTEQWLQIRSSMYTFYKMAIETLAKFPDAKRYIQKLQEDVIVPKNYIFKPADNTFPQSQIIYPEPTTIQ